MASSLPHKIWTILDVYLKHFHLDGLSLPYGGGSIIQWGELKFNTKHTLHLRVDLTNPSICSLLGCEGIAGKGGRLLGCL